jgi:glycosyltransferase involved in cell wall biosynthesis
MSDRIPESPPVIQPVNSEIQQPLWSVMIPSYNCAKYIKKALENVLMQDPGKEKMQIEVVDDCSTDEVEKIVNEIGKGRVSFFKQPYNKGSLRNFETCLNRSYGRYIHLLHGDDFVEPGFYKEIEKLFEAYPEAGAACTSFLHVDENDNVIYQKHPNIANEPGLLKNWLVRIAQGQKLQPPSVVVKRSVYEQIGGYFGMHYGEDWLMWVRIAKDYPFAYTPLPLARYRIHDDYNITALSFKSGQHIKDIQKAINLIQNYLPDEQKRILKKIAKKNWSLYFAETSHLVYYRYNNPTQAAEQAVLAFKLSMNTATFFNLLKYAIKLFLNKVNLH